MCVGPRLVTGRIHWYEETNFLFSLLMTISYTDHSSLPLTFIASLIISFLFWCRSLLHYGLYTGSMMTTIFGTIKLPHETMRVI
jgi:hypothetical protein